MNHQLLNVFIVEDKKYELQDLLEIIAEHFPNQLYVAPGAHSNKIDDAIQKIEKLQSEDKIDLLFLDLKMYGDTESIAILQELSEINFEIICITSYPKLSNRISEEFGSYVCGFVDKKTSLESQISSINVALQVLRQKQMLATVQFGGLDRLKAAETQKGKLIEYFINPQEIIMIQSDRNWKTLFLTQKEAYRTGRPSIMIKSNWEGLENLFKTKGWLDFMRVHDKYMVNLSYIYSFNRRDNLAYLQCEQIDFSKDIAPLRVSIGQKYKEDFLKILNGFGTPKH